MSAAGLSKKTLGEKACLPGRRAFTQLIAGKQFKQAGHPGAKPDA
jgi:hypothetical protein